MHDVTEVATEKLQQRMYRLQALWSRLGQEEDLLDIRYEEMEDAGQEDALRDINFQAARLGYIQYLVEQRWSILRETLILRGGNDPLGDGPLSFEEFWS